MRASTEEEIPDPSDGPANTTRTCRGVARLQADHLKSRFPRVFRILRGQNVGV
jgi:hypothetical protein